MHSDADDLYVPDGWRSYHHNQLLKRRMCNIVAVIIPWVSPTQVNTQVREGDRATMEAHSLNWCTIGPFEGQT